MAQIRRPVRVEAVEQLAPASLQSARISRKTAGFDRQSYGEADQMVNELAGKFEKSVRWRRSVADGERQSAPSAARFRLA
ncbi:hypothetical protein [Virgifigura deserti]|uniref:hypothetical protein n=1 Tax=Virgifigura deserti TaxID=2268457 RepID=UPI003CCC0B21